MKIGENKTVRIKGVDKYVGTMEFNVIESGAFNYGNKTATVVISRDEQGNEKNEECFDTRYFRGTLDDFIKYYEENELRSCLHFVEV